MGASFHFLRIIYLNQPDKSDIHNERRVWQIQLLWWYFRAVWYVEEPLERTIDWDYLRIKAGHI